MRLVVDTNVLVSILIRPGSALSSLAEKLDQPDCTLLYSAETLAELVDVLRRRKFAKYTTPEDVTVFVEWFIDVGELIEPIPAVQMSRDPKDNKFIALAVAGEASYIVTGDDDLLVLKQVSKATIVTPADFLTMVG